MIKASQTGIGLIVSAWALGFSASASAQLAPPPLSTTATSPSSALMMNPFYNPYVNPLINPAAPQQNMSKATALGYLFSAQAARGGIGSGRLSNPGTAANTRKKPANMPNSAARPGGGAARFFNPGVGNGNGAGRYYNQRGSYFQNTGN